MLQGLYAAAAGMEAQQNQFTAVSNDLSNLNTTGYQSAEVGFQDLLYSSAGPAASGTNVATGTGASSAIVGRSQAEGSLQQTGQPLDVAISGPGFIEVRRNDGSVGLTRNGTLQTNAQGEVTNQTGQPLVPSIKIPKGVDVSQVKIAANGQVSANGRSLGKISLVNVPAPNQLQPDGDSTFSVTAASGAAKPTTGATLQQGALEGSNVDVATDMAEMVNGEKSYDMASKAIQYQDQMLQIANGLKK